MTRTRCFQLEAGQEWIRTRFHHFQLLCLCVCQTSVILVQILLFFLVSSEKVYKFLLLSFDFEVSMSKEDFSMKHNNLKEGAQWIEAFKTVGLSLEGGKFLGNLNYFV